MRAILLTVLLTTLPSELTSELTGDFAGELRRVFRPTREPSEVHKHRARVLAGAPAQLDDSDLEALIDAYSNLEKELRPLEEKHGEFLERGRRDKLREPRPDVDSLRELMGSIEDVLDGVSDPDLARLLCEQALAGKRLPLDLRLDLAEAGRALWGTDVTELVKKARRARAAEDILTSLVLAAALGRDGSALAEQAIEALSDENDLLRAAAIDALVATGAAAGIPALIERLDGETGRMKTRVTHALQVLTGARIHGSSSSWREWLAEEGAPYLTGERTLGHGEPVASNADVAGTYYGVPLDGESLLFLLDVSKSMSSSLRKSKGDQPAGESRIGQAKGELIRALGNLPPSKRFGIIAFGGTLVRFSEDLVPADEENVSAAQEWVEELELNLGTRIHDALQLAFMDAGWSPGPNLFDPEVETLFLLTDGRPIVAGKTDKQGAILSAARRFNLRGHLVIHTVGLGSDIPKGFLKSLAKEHGGTFVHEKGSR